MKDCLFKKECQSKVLVSAIIQIAFELGRNFEQIYLDLDLYNIINTGDFIFAIEKGAMFDIKECNIESIAKSKYQDVKQNRKYQRLIEIKNQVNSLTEKYF